MKCKGCGEDKKLIDAHIIPKSFFMNLRGESNHLDVVASDGPDRKGRTFKGEYDTTILCSDCDGLFQKCDNYAKTLLIDKENKQKELSQDSKIIGWEIEDLNYDLFRRFVLSVFWRASISKRPHFDLVRLGSHESVIKEELFGGKRSPEGRYEFWVSKFLPDKIPDLERTMLNPDSIKIEGINFSRLFFLGYTIWIKIDKRNSPLKFDKLKVSDGEPLRIICRSFGTSKERELIIKMHNRLKT